MEIGEAEALGMLGGEWESMDWHYMATGENAPPVYEVVKGVPRPKTMQLMFGADPADPGQLIIWRAFARTEAYPFRLVFSDGVTVREWFALVMSCGEVFDEANGVIRLQAEFKPCTPFIGGQSNG
ncbi:hypothetical protein [Paracoccus sp. NSM]|uniref:hypothetical protein n=1 Tax=Paracoccus sp. NSM TaxID=3457784 RepID=UPI0040364184